MTMSGFTVLESFFRHYEGVDGHLSRTYTMPEVISLLLKEGLLQLGMFSAVGLSVHDQKKLRIWYIKGNYQGSPFVFIDNNRQESNLNDGAMLVISGAVWTAGLDTIASFGDMKKYIHRNASWLLHELFHIRQGQFFRPKDLIYGFEGAPFDSDQIDVKRWMVGMEQFHVAGELRSLYNLTRQYYKPILNGAEYPMRWHAMCCAINQSMRSNETGNTLQCFFKKSNTPAIVADSIGMGCNKKTTQLYWGAVQQAAWFAHASELDADRAALDGIRRLPHVKKEEKIKMIERGIATFEHLQSRNPAADQGNKISSHPTVSQRLELFRIGLSLVIHEETPELRKKFAELARPAFPVPYRGVEIESLD